MTRNEYGFPIPHPSDIEQIEILERMKDAELEQMLYIEEAEEPAAPAEGDELYNYV